MSERRKRDVLAPGSRSGEDRRIIERLSNPRITEDFKHIQKWVRGMGLMILAGAAGKFLAALLQVEPMVIAYEAFFTVFMVIFAVLLFKYAYAIDLFLKNESVTNLETATERQHDFWRSTGIFAFIFIVVGLIFSFRL